MDAEPAQGLPPIIVVQSVEGAGERSSPGLDEVKDGESSVCFERMGMGDLEAVEIADAVNQATASTGGLRMAWAPTQPSMSCCFMEWTPADSSDDDDVGLLDAVDHDQPPGAHDDSGGISWNSDLRPRVPTPAPCQPALSKLSIANVSVISFPAGAQQAEVEVRKESRQQRASGEAYMPATGQYDDADLEGLLEESEDEVSLKAPTPDNTPVNSSPGEACTEPDSALLSSTLNDMVSSGAALAARTHHGYSGSSTPSPDLTPTASPEASPAGTLGRSVSTLGRVWSRLLGRGSTGSKKAAPVSHGPSSVTLHPQRQTDSEDDEDDSESLVLEIDPHIIDELEATLEEVRLDGDGDDPVVSYFVEEAEDVVRPQAGLSGDVTVEEVHDEEGDEEGGEDDVGDPAPEEPAPRPSGLLFRLFSRSRTSQDVTSSELGVLGGQGVLTVPAEPTRRAGERGPAVKRGKTEASSRDRLHRLKPRQPNKAAVRGSLPRILSRWLRQGEAGVWGAEGDAGEAVVGGLSVSGVSPRLGRRVARGAAQRAHQPSQPPALQRTRRVQPLGEVKNTRPLKDLEEESMIGKHHGVNSTPEEKLVADFGSQAGESMLPKSTSFQTQESTSTPVAQASDFI